MNIKLNEKNDRFVFFTRAKSGYENPPSAYDSVYCSKQITLANAVSLTSQAPPCEKVLSNTHSLRIQHAKTIDSVEIIDGKPLKGKKLIVTGIIHIKIEYISCQDSSQKAYFYHWEQPFNAVLLPSPCDNNELFSMDFNLNHFMVYAYLEYLQIFCKTEYTLDTTIALGIWLQELNPKMDKDCIEEIWEVQQ